MARTHGSQAETHPLALTTAQRWLGYLTIGVGLVLMNSPATRAALSESTDRPAQSSSMQVAQLFKKPPAINPSNAPATGCGPQGCRLTIDQTVLQQGDKVTAQYDSKDRLVLQTGETRKITLTLAEAILNRSGRVVIPAGTPIEGELVPVQGGAQFVAQRLILNNTLYNFPATSGTIHDTKDPTQTDAGAIAGDAAIGAAGGIVLGQILGQRGITLEQVLGGAATGVLVGNVTAPQAVVINPGDKIELSMTDTFRF